MPIARNAFAGYRQNSKLYFLFEEYHGDIESDLVWDMLQQYGVVSMCDLRGEYWDANDKTQNSILAKLSKFQTEPILGEKIQSILKELGASEAENRCGTRKKGGNRKRTFISFFNDPKEKDNIIKNIPSNASEIQLANYFDEFVRTGVLKDIPSQGALEELEIYVSPNFKSLCRNRRNKR